MIVNGPGRVKALGSIGALTDTSDVMPTLVELCSATLPAGHPIDGHSIAPILRGEKTDVRDWAFSYLGDKRVLRTKRYLVEKNSPDDFGKLYDCGDSRNGQGYQDVTNSTDPEVVKVKQQFEEILATKPVPKIAAQPKKNQPKKNAKRKKKNAAD
jgi:arylsulfatase A